MQKENEHARVSWYALMSKTLIGAVVWYVVKRPSGFVLDADFGYVIQSGQNEIVKREDGKRKL